MDIEQSLAAAADANGDVSDQASMNILMEAMHGKGDSAQAQPGEPAASTETPAPAEPAATPAPAPAPAPAEAPAPAPAEPKPVLLAKDGVHTIDYGKLVEARTAQQAATARAEAAETELARLRATAATPTAPAPAAAAPAPATEEDKVTFGDYSDESLRAGVEKIVAVRVAEALAKVDAKLEPVATAAKSAAVERYYTPIYSAHPDADSIVQSQEFEAWKASLPSYARAGVESIQDSGTSAQVVEVLNSYRTAHPKVAPAQAPAAPAPAPAAAAPALTTAQRAEQIAAKAKPAEPMSLTDIPAGTPHVPEAEAMDAMNSQDMLFSMMGQSPEKIAATLSRLV